MNCLFCNNSLPKRHYKYCSSKCVKRAWYVRNNPTTKSHLIKHPDFWKTETGIGFKWEKYVADRLGANHLEFNNRGLDLDWNGKSIDVKSSFLKIRKNKRGKPVAGKQKGYWCFHSPGKNMPDYFACIAILDDKPFRLYLIPSSHYPKGGAAIGWKSKWDKYIFK